jgi:hypothetical protein
VPIVLSHLELNSGPDLRRVRQSPKLGAVDEQVPFVVIVRPDEAEASVVYPLHDFSCHHGLPGQGVNGTWGGLWISLEPGWVQTFARPSGPVLTGDPAKSHEYIVRIQMMLIAYFSC